MASLRAELTGKPDVDEPGAPPDFETPPAESGPEKQERGRARLAVPIFAGIFSAFWVGATLAFLWGYFGLRGFAGLAPHLWALAAIATILPPFLFLASAFAFVRARAMGDAARDLAAVSERLTAMDETVPANVQRLGRAVRRELDALSAGLDGAFGRMRALETALEDRIAQLEDAGARAGVRADAIAERLHAERRGIEDLANAMDGAANRAAETLAGRVAHLHAMIENAGGELKAAGQVLETQSQQFRESAEKAAAAPQMAAVELDRQAKHIEAAGDTVVARAEFVLARQERQRNAMSELLGKLREDTATFETVFEAQRNAIERAASQLGTETQRLEEISEQGIRRMDTAMVTAAARAGQISLGFGREAERLKETAETAAGSLSRLVDGMRDAAGSAETLMRDSTADAGRRSQEFVHEAISQSDRLLHASAAIAEEAQKARAALAQAAEEAQRHIVSLPEVASKEAARVREMLRHETTQMLDISARTLATLQARSMGRKNQGDDAPSEAAPPSDAPPEGLRGLARRITAPRRKPDESSARPFELSAVLAAVEARDTGRAILKPGTAVALGALQVALADLASDLDAGLRETDNPDLWRRYLDGDRGVFARTLAGSIGPETVNRIAALYRDNPRFHDAADAYLEDFEALLARARESDRDGFLASTLLSADTGKIYLAVAYALGRLE